MAAQQQQPQNRVERVNVNTLMEKVQSKRDVYNFLSMECEAYLPKMDTINTYFLKQITSGKKDVSALLTDLVVYQALGGEDRGGAPDRGPGG
jgi:hypothetical protein